MYTYCIYNIVYLFEGIIYMPNLKFYITNLNKDYKR